MTEIAHGEVKVDVNDRGLSSELRAAEARFAATMAKIDAMEAEAEVGIDLKRLHRDAALAEAEINRLEDRIGKTTDARLKRQLAGQLGYQRRIARARKDEIRQINETVNAQKGIVKGLEREAAAASASVRYDKERVRLKREAATASSRESAEVAKLQQRHVKLREEVAKVDQEMKKFFTTSSKKQRLQVDKDAALHDIAAVEKRIASLGAKPHNIEIDVDYDRDAFANFFRSLSSVTTRIGPFTLSIKQLVAALSLLGPVIVGLAAYLSTLTGAIGAGLVGAVGVGGAALTGFGLIGIGLFTALKPLVSQLGAAKTASKAYGDAVLKYGKNSTQAKTAQDKLNQTLKGVSPGARKAIGDFGKMSAEYKKLTTQKLKAPFFETIGSAMKAANRLMPMFAKNTVAAGKVAATALQGVFQQLSGPQAAGSINKIMGNTTKMLGPLISGFGNLASAALNVFSSFSRFLPGAGKGFEAWTQSVLAAAQPGAKLDGIVNHLMQSFKATWNVLKGASRVLFEFFRAAAGPGTKNLNELGDSLNKLADRMGSVEGQKKLKNFFEDFSTTAKKFWGAFKPILQLFYEFATIMNPATQAALSLVSPLAQLLHIILQFKPVRAILMAAFGAFLAGRAIQGAIRMWEILKGILATIKAIAAIRGLGDLRDLLMGRGGFGKKGPQAPIPVPLPDPKKEGGSWVKRLLPAIGIGIARGGAALGSFFAAAGLDAKFLDALGLQRKGKLEKSFSKAGADAIDSWVKGAQSRDPATGSEGLGNKLLGWTGLDDVQSKGVKALQKFIDDMSKTVSGRRFILKIATEGGDQAKATLEDLAKFNMGRKLLEIFSHGGPEAQGWLIRIANTKIGKKFLDIFARGGPEAQGWLNRLAATKLGRKFLDIISRGGPQAVTQIRMLAQTKIGRKFLDIISRGGPEAARQLRSIANTKLGRKLLQIIERGGPNAIATINKLRNAQLREKILKIIQRGGPQAQRQIEHLIGLKLPTKTQTLRDRGGRALVSLLGRVKNTRLGDKSTTLRAHDLASSVINHLRSIHDLGVATKTIRVINQIGGLTQLGIPLKARYAGGPVPGYALGTDRAMAAYASADQRTPAQSGRGGRFTQPRYIVGEERRPEVVIASNPAYRKQNLHYFALAGRMLGVPGFAEGGTPSWLAGLTSRKSKYGVATRQIKLAGNQYESADREFTINMRGRPLINEDGTPNTKNIAERDKQVKYLIHLKNIIAYWYEELVRAIENIIETIKAAIPRDRRTWKRAAKRVGELTKREGELKNAIKHLPKPHGTKAQKKAMREANAKKKKQLQAKLKDVQGKKKGEKARVDQYKGYVDAEKSALPGFYDELDDAKQGRKTAYQDVRDLESQFKEDTALPAPPSHAELSIGQGEAMVALSKLMTDPTKAYDTARAGIELEIRGHQEELQRAYAMLRDPYKQNDAEAYRLITENAEAISGLQGELVGLGGGSAQGTFNAARYDLYKQFGGNAAAVRSFVPPAPNMGTGVRSISSGDVAGSALAASTIPVATAPGVGVPGSNGQRIVNIENNFQAPPPDPHTWTRQQAFEANTAL